MANTPEGRLKELHTKKLNKDGWCVISLIQTTWNGIPDKMALKKGRLVFLEYKKDSKTDLEPLQEYRSEQLIKMGFEVYKVDDPTFQIPEEIPQNVRKIDQSLCVSADTILLSLSSLLTFLR